jgi:hypothetical protein
MHTKSDVSLLVDEACMLHAALGEECSALVASALDSNRTGQPFLKDLRALCDKHRETVQEILLRFLSADLAAFSDRELKLIVSHIRFFRLVCPELADQILATESCRRH